MKTFTLWLAALLVASSPLAALANQQVITMQVDSQKIGFTTRTSDDLSTLKPVTPQRTVLRDPVARQLVASSGSNHLFDDSTIYN
ncbi:hypothetical protein [Nissabacter sp. SGAir0207]|uniref:hypothetical protein n=1 Tax=Nissabacter sp. SGAir0207 TaxID=2126321 RepID=UPI0010CCB5D2|nr:hypothetical protein [Nissabacter sp. SGAir0207]QCR36674.1 hypothetical protein C1N62_11510 [Nissabacter sp. SGAir0207]